MFGPRTCGPSYKPMETQSPREKLPELFHHLHRPLSWLVSPSQSEKSLSSCKKVLEAPHLLSHQLYQEVQNTLTKHALLRRGFFHSPYPGKKFFFAGYISLLNMFRFPRPELQESFRNLSYGIIASSNGIFIFSCFINSTKEVQNKSTRLLNDPNLCCPLVSNCFLRRRLSDG